MSGYGGSHRPVPSQDDPAETRSQVSHRTGASHSPHPSQVDGSQNPASRPPGEVGRPSGPQGYPPPLGYDPGREKQKFGHDFNKRIDLPPDAWVEGKLHTPFARRPGLGSAGKKVSVAVNQFRLTSVPNAEIVQYDVTITPDTGKPAFLKKVWNTNSVQQKLKQHEQFGNFQFKWLYDGRRLLWSRNNVPEMRISVDMDEEQGRMARPDRNNCFLMIIRRSKTIRLASLKAYLEGKMDWDPSVLECMNFFDHLIRQWPSENLLSIKRNFYDTNTNNYKPLNHHRTIEAVKGIYAAMRLNSSIRTGGLGLGINVDVANTTFWRGDIAFIDLCRQYLYSTKREWDGMRWPEIYDAMKPIRSQNKKDTRDIRPDMSDMFRMLRRFRKCQFTVKHRGKANDPKTYTIQDFVWEPETFGFDGANARNYKFTKKNGDTLTIADHFARQYNIRLEHWRMPLIKTTRDGIFPMECIIMKRWQRYNFKLDPDQTANMIKFAVTPPAQRQSAIMENVRALKWVEDPYLQEFGVKINPQMQPVPSRIIQNPVLQFGKKTADPRTSGRWDLRDQTFVERNIRPLKAWAVVVVNGCVDKPTATRFAQAFAEAYKKHGGNVSASPPQFFLLNMQRSERTAGEIHDIYRQVGTKHQAPPDLLFFVLPDKSVVQYERLKKNMDVRLATLSQMVQAPNVQKCNPQYCSNVAMKVNAKLGGSTSKLAKVQFFQDPTMILGVDISHASPGQGSGPGSASMAAVTMSMDQSAVKYQAVCETNGHRVEILSPVNIRAIFPAAVTRWCQKNKTAPSHVFYFRDGISEGEFAPFMEFEVEEVRKILEEIGRNRPKITVIVATKRHHIRFFPTSSESGDKNRNPLPGTVIEHEVTHPFHYDFYLCSHVAIKGTARPVHYQVIHDEIQYPVDKLQAMIYQQCYQYIRSTTPVSIHPAIYYAHLASVRARAHEAIDSSEKDPLHKIEQKQQRVLAKHDDLADLSSNASNEMAIPLMSIGGDEGLAHKANIDFFKGTMWYI